MTRQARAVRLAAALLATIVCAGSINAATLRFAIIGDFGANSTGEQQMAAMVHTWSPEFIATTGDNTYSSTPIDVNVGQYFSDFIGKYTGSYGTGASQNLFFPCLGNHDYTDGGGLSAYLVYFTLPGSGVLSSNSSGNERYYDILWGPVHFFFLNSISQEPDGIDANSVQAHWLQTQLAASQAQWKIVCLHHPPYSSSQHGSTAIMQWPFEAWGADIVQTGHDHVYERIMRDDNADGDSLAYFVNGNGGRPLYTFNTPVPGSTVRYNSNFGAMLCEATDTSLILKAYSVDTPNGMLVDSIALHRPSACCAGATGNVNTFGIVDLSDLSLLVVYLTGSPTVALPCPAEANVDNSGIIDVSDLSMLVNYLTVSPPLTLPSCPSLVARR